MAIQVRCDCGEILRIPRPAPGEEWKCPSCGATIQGTGNGEERADTMEIPIEGSAIGVRQSEEHGNAGAALKDEGNPGDKEEELEEDLKEPQEPEEFEGSGNGIPKGMLWGVFLVLLGLLGMIFLLKPGMRKETPDSGGVEAPRVETPVPAGEDASVRVALETSAGEGAAAPQPALPEGGGSGVGESAPSIAAQQAPAPPAAATAEPPKPEALPDAPSKAQEPGAKAADSASVSTSLAVPQPAPEPVKPEKVAYSKPQAAKPAGAYTLNVGSFKARKNAEALRQDLEQKGIEATVREVRLPDKGTWYRVSVGRFSTPDAARRLGQELERKWQIQSFVAQLD